MIRRPSEAKSTGCLSDRNLGKTDLFATIVNFFGAEHRRNSSGHMPTMIQVAERAKVSIATVSNVIRGTQPVSAALAERVRKAIRDLDYYPNEIARSLKVKQTRMLGMIIPDITNPFFPELIRGAEDTAFERGYFLVTANTNEQLERECRSISAFRSYRVGGILLASATGEKSDHIKNVIQAGIAVVCVDRSIKGLKTDAILLDNARGSQDCVRHLIESGHKKIAIITGPPSLQTGMERLKGYEDALDEARIPVDRKLILEGDFRDESGYRLVKKLLSRRTKPTALFVCNGMMTLGVLKAFDEFRIRCPQDIALATFDDLGVDRSFHPHLTVVVQPSYDIGSRAASLLIDRIEKKSTKGPIIIRVLPTLVVRESTAAWTRSE